MFAQEKRFDFLWTVPGIASREEFGEGGSVRLAKHDVVVAAVRPKVFLTSAAHDGWKEADCRADAAEIGSSQR